MTDILPNRSRCQALARRILGRGLPAKRIPILVQTGHLTPFGQDKLSRSRFRKSRYVRVLADQEALGFMLD